MNAYLQLSISVYKTIIHLLERTSCIEQIGLCFGFVSDEERVKIEDFAEIENIEASSSSFSLDYSVMIKQISYYQQKGENFVGLFHSHPSGNSLLPSKKDINYMRYWPSPFIWLIGVFPQILAFEFSNNKVYQIPYILY